MVRHKVSDMQGLFLTGTNTGVGKTQVACVLARTLSGSGVRVGVCKPVCSGAEFDTAGRPVWDDVERLRSALGSRVPRERICPQTFLAPLAPPAAARSEGRDIDYEACLSAVRDWEADADFVIVEGAGGWHCPLTNDRTFADFAVELGFPVVVVAANRLGTINHTLLTLESIRRRGLTVAAVVLSEVTAVLDASAASNAEALERYAEIPLLARLPHGGTEFVTRDGPLSGVDWQRLTQSMPAAGTG